MIKLYIVRHCEAEGNRAHTFQGSTDCDISKDGEKQLEFLKARFSDIHIDKAYSSPLKRAYKTALAALNGKNIPIIKEPLFTEINGGAIEGRPFSDIFSTFSGMEDIWDNHPEDFAPPEGETMRKVYDRVYLGLERIVTDPENEGKTILISSHGAAIRNLLCHIIYGKIENLGKTPWSVNTAVSLIIYNKGVYTAQFLNDDSHLPKDFKPKKSRLLVMADENKG